MKRTVDAIGSIASAAKRLASDLLTSHFALRSSHTTVELRIGVLEEVSEGQQTDEQRRKRAHRQDLINRRGAQLSTSAQQRAETAPHIVLPFESNDLFWRLVDALPSSQLSLSHFTITAASDGATLCHSASFDTQQALDESIVSMLPLNVPLNVQGVAAGFNQRHGLFDAVHITFTLTLREADEQATSLLAAPTMSPTTPSVSQHESPATLRVAHVDDTSVQLTTSFRLLPSLTMPMSARLGLSDVRLRAAAKRMYGSAMEAGEFGLVFEMAADCDPALLQCRVHPPDVLSFHRRRVLAAGNEGYNDTPRLGRYCAGSIIPAYVSLCPTARLCCVLLCYAPNQYFAGGNHSLSHHCVALEVEVQSDTDMQLRGLHLVRPRLRFPLHNRACGEQYSSSIHGQSHASYAIAGSEEEQTDVSADVTISASSTESSLVVEGRSLDVARMADILTHHLMQSAPQPQSSASSAFPSLSAWMSSAMFPRPSTQPPSSFTTLRWTLDSLLARQLPHLVPSAPPTPPSSGKELTAEQSAAFHKRWNRVSCRYDLKQHSLSGSITYGDLCLGLTEISASPLPPTPTLRVLLSADVIARPSGVRFVQFQLRPFLHFDYRLAQRAWQQLFATTALMSLAQLLRLIHVPTELVPPALLDRVRFSDVTAQLLVDAETGVAHCIAGTAKCGPSKRDELLFYSKLAPAAAAPPARTGGGNDNYFARSMENVLQLPIQHWLRLQCRTTLDPAVFPQLATLTAGRCLEPLYQYVLCEVEGGVELTNEQNAEFEAAHPKAAWHEQYHSIQPLKLRPTNAVFALHLQLPSGYLELPTSLLSTLPASPTAALSVSSTCPPLSSSSSSSTSSSALSSRLIVELTQRCVDVLRHCASYLDANSLLLGLLPAVHSLPFVTAALTSSAYGRRVLLDRYGAWSDAALWSAELLSKWRVQGYREQKQHLQRRREYTTDEDGIAEINRRRARLDSDEHRAHKRDIYWAAVIDLQTRINRYLIRVMLQRKEDVLPQLHTRPHHHHPPSQHISAGARPGTVRPVYLTAPNAAMELLLCVPPFHPLPAGLDGKDVHISTDRECSFGVGEQAINNASPHHIDFAAFLFDTDGSDGSSLWSLYMGPVYVYESEHTAGRGLEMDMAELLTRRNEWGNLLIDQRGGGQYEDGRAVRLTYIDDVDQLPVTRRMPWVGGEDIALYAHTLAACFRRTGVTAMIDRLRAKWRREAERRAAAEGRKAGATSKQQRIEQTAQRERAGDDELQSDGGGMAGAEDEESQAGQGSERDGEEEEKEDDDDSDGDFFNDAMDDRDGAMQEYVTPLMVAHFRSLDSAMWKEPTWTAEAAEMAAAGVGVRGGC